MSSAAALNTDTATRYVVFEHTEKDGGYAGIRTFSGYQTEEELTTLLGEMQSIKDGKLRVLGRGLSMQQAQNITRGISTLSKIGSAIEDAVDADGKFNPEIFQMKMLNNGIEVGLWGVREGANT